MARLALVDAPLDCSGAGRGEERAPAALRAAGLAERLGARDAGEADARIRDTRRDPATGVVGAADVRRASSAVAARVRELLDAGERPLVLGGDCTLLLGVFQALPSGSGLWFVDGHADFFDGESSPTGEAADMDLAILTGHGPRGLLEGDAVLLDPGAAVLLGHRPGELHPDVATENARLDPAIQALTAPEVRERGPARVGGDAAARLAGGPAGCTSTSTCSTRARSPP
jgi:arginase